jgi:hypothetical protein
MESKKKDQMAIILHLFLQYSFSYSYNGQYTVGRCGDDLIHDFPVSHVHIQYQAFCISHVVITMTVATVHDILHQCSHSTYCCNQSVILLSQPKQSPTFSIA